MLKKCLFIVMIILFVSSSLILSEEDAQQIISKVEEKQKVETGKSQLSMLIFPVAENNNDYRSMKVISYSKGENNVYLEFVEPRSIKGLRLLSLGNNQWIYFPSTGRVRKIASKAKDQSVQGVGGDFSYEDLGGGNWEDKYKFTILESDEEKWILEGTPKKETVYSKICITIRKKKYQVEKIEYYKEDKGHYKDLFMSKYKQFNGYETATQMIMVNYDEHSKTVIIIHDAQYNVPIDEKYFNPHRFYK